MENYNGILLANSTGTRETGNVYTDKCIILEISASRGALHQRGTITLNNKLSVIDVIYDYKGDDIGISFTASITATNKFSLAFTVDNSSIDDIQYTLNINTIKI